MLNGHYFVPMKPLVLINAMAKSLKLFISNMNKKAKLAAPWVLKSCGLPSLMLKLRLVCLTCSTKVRSFIAIIDIYLNIDHGCRCMQSKIQPKELGHYHRFQLVHWYACWLYTRGSNIDCLLVEIIEYSAPDEVAVCNLASLALPKFVSDGAFDFDKLHKVTKVVAKNLNRVIDVNYYPVEEAKNSNMRHRP